LLRSCVNGGGPASRLRLAQVPVAEQELVLGEAFAAALTPWQARCGEIVTAVDPEQLCWRVRLTALGQEVRGVPFDPLPHPAESPLQLSVFQSLPDKERFELILQKLTELGVARIVPVETEHSLTRAERDAVQEKSHRWPEVIVRAAKQCRRAMLPELGDTVPLATVLAEGAAAEVRILCHAGEEHWTLRDALGSRPLQRVCLLVGPEGGFSAGEVAAARAAGFLPVTFGPRLLRTETAALAAATLVQGLAGDLC
jgi:16S rRNA (uracil1498-N3)-methyltransferase